MANLAFNSKAEAAMMASIGPVNKFFLNNFPANLAIDSTRSIRFIPENNFSAAAVFLDCCILFPIHNSRITTVGINSSISSDLAASIKSGNWPVPALVKSIMIEVSITTLVKGWRQL